MSSIGANYLHLRRQLCLALLLVGTLVWSGCASSTDKEDESWRTASQRVGEVRPLEGDKPKKAPAESENPESESAAPDGTAPDGTAPESTEEAAEADSGRAASRLKAPPDELEEPIRLDPHGPYDREDYVRWSADLPKPLKVHDPQPRYTEEARKAKISGFVAFDLLIDEEGEVTAADLVQGLPKGLTEQAYETLKQWRFEPVVVDGEAIKIIYRVTAAFRIQ